MNDFLAIKVVVSCTLLNFEIVKRKMLASLVRPFEQTNFIYQLTYQTMKRLLSLAMVLCLVATAAMAQVTTSAIRGKVQSTTGEEIIGATIQAVHIPTGTNYGAVTNVSGNFMLTGLRAGGPYKVTVSYVGFRTQVFEGITLQLGETFELDVKMAENSQQLGEVVVTADKTSVFNMNRMGSAQNFDSKAIQQTASISRSVFDVTKTNPLAMSTGGGTSFGGANNKYNSFQVDGAVSNDVFGLSGTGTNGGQTGANPISLEAIEEVQVVIAPFDVRKSGFTGGGINAITKSGTNDFHGSAYMFYNNENFYGKTPGKRGEDFTGSRKKLGDQSTKTYGFTVGGPIIKNKLFFFANYEKNKEKYLSSNVIGTGESALDANEVDQVINYLQTNWGTDAGGYGAINVPTENEKFLARLDWNINDQHKLMFRYSMLDAEQMKSVTSSKTAGLLLASGYNMVNKTNEFVAELNSNFDNGMNNIFRATYTRVRDHRDPNASPLSNVTIKGLTNTMGGDAPTLNFGIENYSAANALDQDIYTIEDNFTWSVGDHKVTVGTHNEFFNMANLFIAYAGGSYTYDNLSDFLNNDPSYYRYQYSREDITGTNRWMPEWGAGQIGFYGQDEWRVNDNFRLTYGVRVDVPLFFDDPMTNDTFNNSALAAQHHVATGELPSSTPLISPRVGFRWWANEDHSTLLRGGVGLFTGRIPFVWISNAFSNTGMGMAGTKLSNKDAIAAARAKGFEVNYDPNNQWIDPTAAIPTAEVDVVDHDFKFPQTLRANFAVEQQLPFGVRGTLEAMYSKTYNNILYNNINYAQDGTKNAASGDNRPMWSKVDNNFTDVILLSNTNKGYNYNVTAKLEKSFDFGLNAMVAYTYGQARSVNDGASSQAYSCWKYNYNYYNDASQEVTWSNFDVRNRIIANISYRKEYLGNFATEVSLFYQGYSGGRYSLVEPYSDANGDGYKGNDVLYLPTRDKAVAAFGAEANDYLAWLDRNSELDGYVGSYVPRNAMRKDFEHHFDFHFAQDFFINAGKRRHTLQFNFDILNIGNLFNPEWGVYGTPSNGYSVSPITLSKDGHYSFADIKKIEGVESVGSRWHAQIGVKYTF